MLDSQNAIADEKKDEDRKGRFSLRRSSKNYNTKTILTQDNFVYNNIPRWKEERQTNSALVTLSTDVEHIFQYNPSVVDRIFVLLLVGCSEEFWRQDITKGMDRDLNIRNVKFVEEWTQEMKPNIRKEVQKKVFDVISFIGDLDITEPKKKVESKYPKLLWNQYPSTVRVEGKIYVYDIGSNAKLLYVYVSNCDRPNLIPFLDLVGNSIPSSSATLFESLFLDLDPSLWIKCPYGWKFVELHERPNAMLISPIQLRAEEEGRHHALDKFIMKRLETLDHREMTEEIVQNMAKACLELISSSHQNCVIKSEVQKKTMMNSNKKERTLFVFEVEYDMEGDEGSKTISCKHHEAIVHTYGNNVWSLVYASNMGSKYSDLFEAVLSEIKTEDV